MLESTIGPTRPATVRDSYTALNFLGVVGNTMIRRLLIGGSEPMPLSVTCEAVQSLSGKELSAERQPSVNIDIPNREIVLTFPAPSVRSDAAHIIYFDSRKVLAGRLYFGYETTSEPDSTSETVYLPTASNAPVFVSVLVGASAGGGGQSTSYALTGVTTARYRHNFGQVPSATVLNSSGVEISAAVRHIYETGSTITNEIEITSNQPITGRLILHA